MTARDDIAAHFTSDALSDELLDAYRAEVLAEVADRIVSLPGFPFNGDYTPVLDLLTTMAHGEKASAPAPTATPGFFQVGRTYTEPDGLTDWKFRCDAITTHPEDGERTALGWRHFRSEWSECAYTEDDWEIHQIADRLATASTVPAPTATPQPEPAQSGEWATAGTHRDRLADLLTHIRKHPTRTWVTEDVRRFYLSRAPKRATCRRDLTALTSMGWLTEHDEPGRRYFTLNTRTGGQS